MVPELQSCAAAVPLCWCQLAVRAQLPEPEQPPQSALQAAWSWLQGLRVPELQLTQAQPLPAEHAELRQPVRG